MSIDTLVTSWHYREDTTAVGKDFQHKKMYGNIHKEDKNGNRFLVNSIDRLYNCCTWLCGNCHIFFKKEKIRQAVPGIIVRISYPYIDNHLFSKLCKQKRPK